MEDIQKQIEDFQKTHPEIVEAMEIFKMSMDEYRQAFAFLNEPQIYTSNTSNPDYPSKK